MKKLDRDEVRQRLRVMLYQERKPVARIAKEAGMDAKTIQLASNGEMTNRTLIRFQRYLDAKEKEVEFYQIKENVTETASGSKKKLQGMILNLNNVTKLKFGSLNDKTFEELRAIYLETENIAKFRLLKQHHRIVEKYSIMLYDKWDYWQWREKIELIIKDMRIPS